MTQKNLAKDTALASAFAGNLLICAVIAYAASSIVGSMPLLGLCALTYAALCFGISISSLWSNATTQRYCQLIELWQEADFAESKLEGRGTIATLFYAFACGIFYAPALLPATLFARETMGAPRVTLMTPKMLEIAVLEAELRAQLNTSQKYIGQKYIGQNFTGNNQQNMPQRASKTAAQSEPQESQS